MTAGVIGLVVALVVATAIGLVMRRRAGRFRPQPLAVPASAASVSGGDTPVARAERLTTADLGTALGERATLVQFSTVFCAPCRPTRQILAQVADMVDGVVHVDIDATSRLDLVGRLRINSTPTILVLGPDGAISTRASGLPRKPDVIAALGRVIGEAAHSTSSTGSVDNVGNSSGQGGK
jgi:thiol-disulfide isomerase/thioredoxin